MADRIKVHTDRLGMDAGRIQSCIRNLTKEMDAMKQSVAELENMWEGPARSAFHKAFWDDMQAVTAAVTDLKGIYDYDMNAKEQYEQCDRKIASMVEDIRI